MGSAMKYERTAVRLPSWAYLSSNCDGGCSSDSVLVSAVELAPRVWWWSGGG